MALIKNKKSDWKTLIYNIILTMFFYSDEQELLLNNKNKNIIRIH